MYVYYVIYRRSTDPTRWFECQNYTFYFMCGRDIVIANCFWYSEVFFISFGGFDCKKNSLHSSYNRNESTNVVIIVRETLLQTFSYYTCFK